MQGKVAPGDVQPLTINQANKNMRVNIPTNPEQLIKLAQQIKDKHAADGATSPLAGLNMADMSTKTTTADTENKQAAKSRRDAEKSTQNRDLALGVGAGTAGTVDAYVRSARDILLGINKGNEQKLGDWGFEVDTSARPAPKPPTP